MSAEPRPYQSALRNEQARATRRRIVGAAAELFTERGYGPTTIDAVAERAGVGRKTVFTSVGGKATMLKLAFDWALAGDDEPVAIADRPEVRQMMEGADAEVLLDSWIAMNADIAQRLAPLHHVLVVASDGDADAAALLSTTDEQRAQGARAVMHRLDALGALRPGLDVDRAAGIADVLIDPMPYRRLVVMRDWPFETYVEHLQRIAAASLLR